jgi:L-alanine-DL-glutamate epimerase-like enolase superfamily enzyme
MACIDTPYPFLECGIEDDNWERCYEPRIEIKDGRAAVPTAPGWGFEPTQEFLAKSEYKISK